MLRLFEKKLNKNTKETASLSIYFTIQRDGKLFVYVKDTHPSLPKGIKIYLEKDAHSN